MMRRDAGRRREPKNTDRPGGSARLVLTADR